MNIKSDNPSLDQWVKHIHMVPLGPLFKLLSAYMHPLFVNAGQIVAT